MKARKVSQRTMISAALGVAGAVILVVALPSWLLFSLLGVGLVAGAYLTYKSGM